MTSQQLRIAVTPVTVAKYEDVRHAFDTEQEIEATISTPFILASCHNCRVVLDSTQQTVFLFREQGKRTIPAERRQRLFGQLQAAFLAKEDEG